MKMNKFKNVFAAAFLCLCCGSVCVVGLPAGAFAEVDNTGATNVTVYQEAQPEVQKQTTMTTTPAAGSSKSVASVQTGDMAAVGVSLLVAVAAGCGLVATYASVRKGGVNND